MLCLFTIIYKSRLTPNKLYKKTDAILSIYGRNRINPWHFFLNSHLGLSRLSRSNDNWCWILRLRPRNFENHKIKFGFSPQNGKVDLCTTNGSKVLIYLTFLYFIFYCTLVSNAKGNLAKSNKSELWNRLSYRGLPYHFEVRSQSFRNDCKSWRSQPQKFNLDFHVHMNVIRAEVHATLSPSATSIFGIHSWNFGSSPQNGKVDLCMTNCSKVLIYLTLLNFLLHYLQEYSKIWNIEKSNKS